MSLFVVDASVGVKWFVQEIHSDAAARLQAGIHELHIPDFFDVEVANILWKKVQRGDSSRADADAALNVLPRLTVKRHADAPLIVPAFDIAIRSKRTAYDCLYLALAIQLGGKMATADDRLINALAGSQWAAFIVHIKNVP